MARSPRSARGGKDRVEALLGKMSLEEKCAQLCSTDMPALLEGRRVSTAKCEQVLANGIGEISRVAGDTDLEPEEAAAVTTAIQEFLKKRTRLGIPALVHEECCSGYMARRATMFPQARFVMAHIGGMYNWPNGIAVARKHDNVWVDTSGYVMLCYGAMVKAVKALGPSKILFGVDFPLILAAPLVTVLKDLKLPRAAFARIAWKNAAELFAV